MEQNPQQQIVERIQSTENVLVTVSNNPSVDQLSACIGLTLLLNKLGKHGSAVFSGEVPSTIEFLQPADTIEKNTDSLQDFIIALDKSKADRLRYKVEDDVVKIFITPYKTSINEKDLEFSAGDFNVDVVIALGVIDQKDLDQVITAHGRILHDATVISVNNKSEGTIGAINWTDTSASSLSEMVASLSKQLAPDQIDSQIATALLTGIVSQTDRFRGENTTPKTMNISADLMSSGANQQLIVTKLEVDLEKQDSLGPELEQRTEQEVASENANDEDGTLYIDHQYEEPDFDMPVVKKEAPKIPEPSEKEIDIDKEGTVRRARELLDQAKAKQEKESKQNDGNETGNIVLQPPVLGGTFTANSRPEELEPTTDPLSMPNQEEPMLNHEEKDISKAKKEEPQTIKDSETLQEIEKEVKSPHMSQVVDIDSARSAVEKAENTQELSTTRPKPLESINAQQLSGDVQNRFDAQEKTDKDQTSLPKPDVPANLVPEDEKSSLSNPNDEEPLPPPPVPPPIMPTTNQ